MAEIHLLGAFRLVGGPQPETALPRKARALLAYLALAGDRPVAREKLATLLWDSGDEQARASLRQALAAIRRAAGAIVDADAESLRLTAGLDVDVHRFEAAPPAEAALLYEGDLLDGFNIPETDFSGWLAAERARLRDKAIAGFELAAAAALDARRPELAIAHGQRLVALDPLHEPGHRLLMRAYAEGGRSGEALRHYRALQASLRAALQAAPEPETVALAARIAGRRREGPAPTLEPPPAEAEPALDPVASRREIRRVAVLSVGFQGYTFLARATDPEDMLPLLAEAHAMVDAECAAAGGVVLDRQADKFTLLFGARRAHDDDPARAARTASRLIERFAAHDAARAPAPPLGVRIGLAAGPLLVTEEGDTLGAVGAALAEAPEFRVMARPGEIVFDPALLPELSGVIGAEPIAPRGERRALRATGPAAPLAAPLRLFGRDLELAQIDAALDAALAADGRTLCLRGEAGLGKSRLAEAACEAARQRGFKVFGAEIADFGDRADITPRRQLVLALLGSTTTAPPDDLDRNPLAQRLAPGDRPGLWQLAGAAAPGNAQPAVPEAADDAQARRDRLFAHLLALAAEAAPLLLVVEDAHWADAVAARQLQELSRHVRGLRALLLVTTRPDGDPFDQAWRSAAGAMTTIDLAPLSPAATAAAAQAFGAPSPALAEVCARRAGGNPLFLQQLVAAVRDGADPEAALPGSVQGLAIGRMDRLEPEERAALRAAAVLGVRVDLAAVRAVADLPDYRPSALAVGPLVTFDGREIAFVHALVRDAVGSTLTASERRPLHGRAASWYEGRNLEARAGHLARAGDPRAAEAWTEAAQSLLQRHRPDKALAALDRADLEAAPPPARFRLALLRAQVQMRLLDTDAAVEAAQRAQAEAVDPADRVLALVTQADAESARLQPDAALALLDEAEALARPAGMAEAMARLLTLRGNIHFPRGRLAECLEAHEGALYWSRKAGTRLAEAGALCGLAWGHYQQGGFGEASRRAGEALDLADGDAFDRIRLSALRVRAVSRIFLLEHEAAIADADAAIALAAAQGDAINELLARTTAGTAHLECWNHPAAFAVAEPALALTARLGGLELEAAPLWVLGTAHGSLGDRAEALRLLEQARVAAMRGHAIRFAVPRILGTLAYFVDAETRGALIAEGEALLARRSVAHSAFGFWGSAIHAALAYGEDALTARCVAGLESFGADRLEPWAAALRTMIRTFGAISAGTASRADLAAAAAFRNRARETRALAWLRPTMRAVLVRKGVELPS